MLTVPTSPPLPSPSAWISQIWKSTSRHRLGLSRPQAAGSGNPIPVVLIPVRQVPSTQPFGTTRLGDVHHYVGQGDGEGLQAIFKHCRGKRGGSPILKCKIETLNFQNFLNDNSFYISSTLNLCRSKTADLFKVSFCLVDPKAILGRKGETDIGSPSPELIKHIWCRCRCCGLLTSGSCLRGQVNYRDATMTI